MTKREFLDTVFALAPNEANAIMDAFDEYVENNEPHWISCKKELPKLDSRCVLLYSNDNISGGYYRGNRTFDVDYGDEDVNTMVIAWMPEPIRGEGVVTE